MSDQIVEDMKRRILQGKEEEFFKNFKNEKRMSLEIPENIDIHKAQLSELGKMTPSGNNSLLFKKNSDTL